MPTADISGNQKKVIEQSVRPARLTVGAAGIPVRNGKTLPFTVERVWSAPAGHYPETFYLIDPKSREVYFEGPVVEYLMLGLQARTELATSVRDRIELTPGSYAIVFALQGSSGGEFPVEVFEVSAEEAA
jgi:hypothetical protein